MGEFFDTDESAEFLGKYLSDDTISKFELYFKGIVTSLALSTAAKARAVLEAWLELNKRYKGLRHNNYNKKYNFVESAIKKNITD